MRRATTVIACTLIVTSACLAAPRMGRYNILIEAHGYNSNGSVLLPLRGISEWLGAEVSFANGLITIKDGSRTVSLKTGASTATVNGKSVKLARPARVYGGVTCVPVRFVGEALGCDVRYVSGPQETAYLNYINHVVLTRGQSKAVVLVHGVSPDVVAGIVKAAGPANPGQRLGWDYLVRVSTMKNGWASAWEPWWFDDEQGFSFKGSGSIYQRTGAGWVHRGSSTRAGVSRDWVRSTGIPLSVLRALEWEVEEEY